MQRVRGAVRPHLGRRSLRLLHGLCASWEEAAHKESQHHAEVVESLWARLEEASDARGRLEQRDASLSEEVRRREEAERHLRKRDEDVRSLMQELRACRDRASEWRRLGEERERALAAEARRREDAERLAAALQQERLLHQEVMRENAALKEAAFHGLAGPLPPEALARRIAELECGPLRRSSPQLRSGLRRRLLAKWHPDKQPSADHAALATLVMQEMQNRLEWEP